MIIKDPLYGTFEINSPVVISLINSHVLQRLKKIAQYGVPDEYYHLKNYSRFQHCVGVMLLLRLIGASEEEQIAGLLHDVSHTAFSHIVDWVVGDGKTEDYQDEQHKKFIYSSEIPAILQKYGFAPKKITDYHHFGLLERDLPDLCADRIDYSLREFPKSLAKKCLSNLVVFEGRIVFTDKKNALMFAQTFLERQMEHWGGFEAASRYRLFADVLRLAIDKRIITMEDFWQDDKFVINKITKVKDQKIDRYLRELSKKSLSHLPKSKTIVHKKFRFVDPLFYQDNKLIRLSNADKKFKEELKDARIKNKKGVLIPQVSS